MEKQILPTVLCFGFSVTAESGGYPAQLREILGPTWTVTTKAFGGMALSVVPYLENILDYGKHDYVLLEVATCLRFADGQTRRYRDLALTVARQVQAAGAMPVFVNLYRNLIDYEVDHLAPAIRDASEMLSLPMLDLTAEMAQHDREGRLKEFLRDGTHTTPLGALLYGSQIAAFLEDTENRFHHRSNGGNGPDEDYRFLPVAMFRSPNDKVERSGVILPVADLRPGERIIGKVPDGFKFGGLLYAMGPETGIMRVISAGRNGRVVTFDEASYYRRFSYWLRNDLGSTFELRQTDIVPKITLRKGAPAEGERIGRVAGIFARRMAGDAKAAPVTV